MGGLRHDKPSKSGHHNDKLRFFDSKKWILSNQKPGSEVQVDERTPEGWW
jgi:hypothetical protein